MTDTSDRERHRWAPWWAYLVPILAVNYLRQLVLPYGTVPEWADVALALSSAAALFLAITAVYRVTRGSGGRDVSSEPRGEPGTRGGHRADVGKAEK